MKLRAFAFAAVLLLAACSKVTQENFSKIQDGMSEQEVTAILGGPAFLWMLRPQLGRGSE